MLYEELPANCYQHIKLKNTNICLELPFPVQSTTSELST